MPRIKGVGEIDWRFDTPIETSYYGSDLTRHLLFAITDLKQPLWRRNEDDEELLMYECGRSVKESSWWFKTPPEVDDEKDTKIIQPVMHRIGRFLSVSSQANHSYVTVGAFKRAPDSIYIRVVEYNPHPIERPTRYITALARKIDEFLARSAK